MERWWKCSKISFCEFYSIFKSALSGSPTNKLSTACQASQGTGSPIPKIHGSSFVTSAVKVTFFCFIVLC